MDLSTGSQAKTQDTAAMTDVASTWARFQANARRPVVAPVLLGLAFFLAGAFWAVSSPQGSTPDDAFHLGSIWCAAGQSTGRCEALSPGAPGHDNALVPERVGFSNCYAYVPTNSAACESDLRSKMVPAPQGVNAGLYPPLFYATLHVFVSDDVGRSVLLMRFFNLALAAVLLASAVALAAPFVRRAVSLAWLGTLVPLGTFFVPSTNPTSWLVTGLGTYWVFLLTFLSAPGRNVRWASGSLAVITAVMCFGTRSDGAAFICIATVAVVLISCPLQSGLFSLRMVLPSILFLIGAALFLRSSVLGVLSSGLGAENNFLPPRTGLGLLLNNMFSFPNLLLGVFGVGWGLGWIDTPMPPGVGGAGVAVVFGLILLSAKGYWLRKAIAVASLTLVLVAVPLAILQRSNSSVGEAVQPRYLLPLAIIALGFSLLSDGGGPEMAWRLGRGRAALLALTATIANGLALHTNLRRYLTGLDGGSLNLNQAQEWWWDTAVSPMAVWLGGTVAGLILFSALSAVALRSEVPRRHESGSREFVNEQQLGALTTSPE